MPQTNWNDLHKSGDARRRLAPVAVAEAAFNVKSLMEHTRAQLNTLAKAHGISDPESMPNKRAVAEAIYNA